MIYFWAPPDPGDEHAHYERFEYEEDNWIILGLFLGVLGAYWLVVHYVDHFTKVECKENTLLDSKQINKLGGPYNVYQISVDTIKFRRQKDAFRYTMFDYRP